MPEGMNIEIAHELAETESRRSAPAELIEIGEAVVLALVAVATAWTGYQSAKWDGHQAFLYGKSGRLRVEAAAAQEEARQLQVYDALALNAWIEAQARKDENLVSFYQRRFTPEFQTAFDAWLKSNPLKNPQAPVGPMFVPEYHNAQLDKAQQLGDEATAAFTEGTEASTNNPYWSGMRMPLLSKIPWLATFSDKEVGHARVCCAGRPHQNPREL